MSYTKQYPFKNEMQFIEGTNSSQHIKMVSLWYQGQTCWYPRLPPDLSVYYHKDPFFFDYPLNLPQFSAFS